MKTFKIVLQYFAAFNFLMLFFGGIAYDASFFALALVLVTTLVWIPHLRWKIPALSKYRYALVFGLSLVSFVFFSVSQGNKYEAEHEKEEIQEIPEHDPYSEEDELSWEFVKANAEMIEVKKFPPHKVSVDVRLKTRFSEEQLKLYATRFRDAFPENEYARAFMVYYLEGMEVGAGGWATTHFAPSLNIQLFGLSKEKFEELSSSSLAKPDGEVLGLWEDGAGDLAYIRLLYKGKDGGYYFRTIHKDGSHADEKVTVKGKRIDYPNDFGEYYMLEEDNVLGSYGEQGRLWGKPDLLK